MVHAHLLWCSASTRAVVTGMRLYIRGACTRSEAIATAVFITVCPDALLRDFFDDEVIIGAASVVLARQNRLMYRQKFAILP